ncbi:MAG TPA: hypothetical protein PKY81_01280 [bacterium]|nr:hypothetical protein [bacterium]
MKNIKIINFFIFVLLLTTCSKIPYNNYILKPRGDNSFNLVRLPLKSFKISSNDKVYVHIFNGDDIQLLSINDEIIFSDNKGGNDSDWIEITDLLFKEKNQMTYTLKNTLSIVSYGLQIRINDNIVFSSINGAARAGQGIEKNANYPICEIMKRNFIFIKKEHNNNRIINNIEFKGKEFIEDVYVVDDGGGCDLFSAFTDVSYSYGTNIYAAEGSSIILIKQLNLIKQNYYKKIGLKMYRKVVPEYDWIERGENINIYLFNDMNHFENYTDGRWPKPRYEKTVLNNLGEKIASTFVEAGKNGWVEWDITKLIETSNNKEIRIVLKSNEIHFSRFFSTDNNNRNLIPRIILYND